MTHSTRTLQSIGKQSSNTHCVLKRMWVMWFVEIVVQNRLHNVSFTSIKAWHSRQSMLANGPCCLTLGPIPAVVTYLNNCPLYGWDFYWPPITWCLRHMSTITNSTFYISCTLTHWVHISQGVCQIVRTLFQFIVVPQSQGEASENLSQICSISPHFSGSSSCNLRTMIHWNVVPTNCINPEICGHYGKLSEIHYIILFSSNCGENVLNSFPILCTQDLRVQHKHSPLLQNIPVIKQSTP